MLGAGRHVEVHLLRLGVDEPHHQLLHARGVVRAERRPVRRVRQHLQKYLSKLAKKIFLLLAWLTWPCWSPLGEKNCSVPGRREGMNCSTALPTEFRVVVGSSSL